MSRAGVAVLAAWLLVMIASAAVIARSPFSTDLQAFLPEAPTPAQQALVDQLKDGVVSRLVLVAVEGDEPSTLARLSRQLSERLADDPAFAYVHNGSEDRLQADRNFLIEHRYLLSPAVTDGHFSAANLRRALQEQLQLLASSMGILTAQLLARDPTGEILAIVDRLDPAQRPRTVDGVWFNAAGNRALLIAKTSAPGFAIEAQQAAVARIHEAFAAASAALGSSDARLIAVGPGVFAAQVREAIKRDAIKVTSTAALAIAALLLFVMRSPRALLLIVVPVASGALVGVAAVALAFGGVHGITIGFGATLIGESVDYAIHLLGGSVRGQRPEKTLARIWPTLRLGVLTSVAGSAALLLSGFPGLAQLGLFSISGLVAALAVTRWVLPLLVPPDFSVALAERWGRTLTSMARRARLARWPSLVLMVGCAAYLASQGGAQWNDSFESLSPISPAAKRLDSEIRAELGAPDVRHLIVVRGVDQEATLQIAEAVAGVLDTLVDRGVLSGYQSPTSFLPSQASQRARQLAIPDEATLRANLAQAARGLPFKPGIFEDFIEQAQNARQAQPLSRRDLASTALADRVDALLVQRRGGWTAMLPLLEVGQPRRLATALSRFDPQQVVLLDLKTQTDALYQGYRTRILTFAVIGAVAIVMLLLAALRSLRRCVSVIMPVVAALVVSVAVLVAAGVALNMFHLVAMLLVIGVGTNYTLFFDRAVKGAAHAERIYFSLLICNLSTVLGFGIVALAVTPVLKAIGSTVALGAALSLFFAAALAARDTGAPDDSSPAGEPAPHQHG